MRPWTPTACGGSVAAVTDDGAAIVVDGSGDVTALLEAGAAATPSYVRDGDVVEVAIAGIGTLRNRFVSR